MVLRPSARSPKDLSPIYQTFFVDHFRCIGVALRCVVVESKGRRMKKHILTPLSPGSRFPAFRSRQRQASSGIPDSGKETKVSVARLEEMSDEQAWRKRSEAGAVLTVTLLAFAATPALADEIPADCVFYKVGTPKYWRGDVQFSPGEAFSLVMIHDEAGKPIRCRYSIRTIPFSITCHGRASEPFSFVGPTLDVQTHDILVFRNAAWYKVCYKPV
jgi:hypothetical protein